MLYALGFIAGMAHAASTTTILGLTLPAYGSYRWDLPMNANSQLLDSLVAVKAATQTFTGANTFVSTSNVYYGSGSNLSGVATSAQLTSTAAALSSEITRATVREDAIAVSTGVLQADLATEVSRAPLRENDIAVSTGALELSKVNRAGDSMTGTLTMSANQYFSVGDDYTLYGKLNNRAYLSGYEGASLGSRNNGTTDGSFEYLIINPLGNVGIGTTTPGTKLEVSGNYVSSGTVYARDGFYGNGATFSGDVTAGSNGLTAGALTVSSITATTAVGVTTYNYGAVVKASGGHGVNSSSFAMSDSSMTYSCAGGGCGFYGMNFDSSKHITFSPGDVLAATFQEDGGLTSVSSITANTFYGPLTGAASLNVLKAGDTMTGSLIIDLNGGGGMSVKNTAGGNAITVTDGGGAGGVIEVNNAAGTGSIQLFGNAGTVEATSFIGNGAALTNLPAPTSGMVFIASHVVTAAAGEASFYFDGLDIRAHEAYYVLFSGSSTVANMSVSVYLNTDTTAANYDHSLFWSNKIGHGSVGGDSAKLWDHDGTNDSQGYFILQLDPKGYAQSNCYYTQMTIDPNKIWITTFHNAVESNITKLTFQSNSGNGFSTGYSVMVYKIDSGI